MTDATISTAEDQHEHLVCALNISVFTFMIFENHKKYKKLYLITKNENQR